MCQKSKVYFPGSGRRLTTQLEKPLKVEYLIGIMSDLNTSDFLSALEDLVVSVRRVAEGDPLGPTGGAPGNCFLVLRGTVEERHTSESGRYMVARVFTRGHVMLPPASRADRLDQVSRVAVSACELGDMKCDLFRDRLCAQPELGQYFQAQCLEALDEATYRLVDTNLVSVRERVRRELLKRAGQHHSRLPTLRIRSHDEFAAYLGANRETVSREIAWFSRRGAIETYRGHIVVKDFELLKEC